MVSTLDPRTLQLLEQRRALPGIRRRGRLVRRALMWADVAGLTAAFTLSEAVYRPSADQLNRFGTSAEYAVFFAAIPFWLVVARLYGLYDRDESRANHSTVDDIVGVFHLVTIVAWLFLAGAYLTGFAQPALTKVVTFWLLAVPLITLLRATARSVCRRRVSYVQSAVVVGAGDVGQLVARKILQHPEYGIHAVGFLDDQPKEPAPGLEEMRLLGSPDQLREIVCLLDIERVIFAYSNDPVDRTMDLIRSLHDLDVTIDVVPRLFDLISPSSEIHTLEGIPLVGIPSLELSRASRVLKRATDVVLAAGGLVLLAPLLVVIALVVKFDSRGPILFRQLRVGTAGRPFRILKFRTMNVEAEEQKESLLHLNTHAQPGGDPRMFKMVEDPRTTHVGGFLRRHSLDEFPQLVNVLRGEMSLVGPRPLILEEAHHVDDWARIRTNLRPGMTGLWQVLGRSEISFDEMVKLDYVYVTTWSLWHDIRLLFRTLPILVRPSGY